MSKLVLSGNIITKERIIEKGILTIENGKITSITSNYIFRTKVDYDLEENYISPGFIDVHIHGCIGKD
ncbi:MAG: N-acetylglucosamine-6-phosphate deacetylase, partial [Dictyoglomus sp.]